MNAIAVHKDELERLLVNLSYDTAVSGIGFVALLDIYITRLDTNLLRHQRTRRYGGGRNKRRINIEPTLTQNCALYYAQHTTSKHRVTFFRKFRSAARRQAPSAQRQMTRGERSRRLRLHRDNGR